MQVAVAREAVLLVQVDQAAGVTPALLERLIQAVAVAVVMVAAQLPKRVVPVLL